MLLFLFVYKLGLLAESAHRKLLLQVEETMAARLAEAEANVAAVQKACPLSLSPLRLVSVLTHGMIERLFLWLQAARRKMNCLKGALKEWLTDDFALR